MLHLAVNEATRPDITSEDRQKILNYIARYASRNPENAGRFADALGAILGLRGPVPGARFASRKLLLDHFRDHGSDLGARTVEEYEAQAEAFLTGPARPGTLQKIRTSDGTLVRYNSNTDEFGVLDPKTNTIRTYYEPDPMRHGKATNLDYYNSQ